MSVPEKNNVSKSAERSLGLSSLLAIAAGTVIGAGVVSSTGAAIAQTGRSVWLAYAAAVVLGFLLVLPQLFYSTVVRYRGGYYTIVSSLMGEKWGGIYSLCYLLTMLQGATMSTAAGSYLHSVFPMISVKVGGIVVSTIFFMVNLYGLKMMAGLQRIMTVVLVVALMGFALAGFGKLSPGTFQISDSSYFLNGSDGFLTAMVLLVGSCTGHGMIAGFSYNAKNAKRDIPLTIILASGIILILYTSVALTAGNVLPVETVAGKPLTLAAQSILPGILFPLFIICGPLLALGTTMNSGYAATTAPVYGGIRDGWMPKVLGTTNKNDVPWVLYSIKYAITLALLLFGFNLTALIANMVLVNNGVKLLIVISLYFMPRKFGKHWEKSPLHMKNGLFYLLMTIVLAAQIFVVIRSAKVMPLSLILVNVIGVILLTAYAMYRYYTHKVNVQLNYFFDD